jgi:hypothetical protein
MNFARRAAKLAEAKLEKAQSVVAAKAAQLDEAYHISEKAGEAKAAVTEKAGEAKAAAKASFADGDVASAKLGWIRDGVSKASNIISDSLSGDLDVCYVTPRLIAMGMPGEPPNTVERLSRFLGDKHGTHYMVWNFSEISYDSAPFQNQVLEFRCVLVLSPPRASLLHPGQRLRQARPPHVHAGWPGSPATPRRRWSCWCASATPSRTGSPRTTTT